MRRHAFNLAALASTLLFLAVLALWWRSRGVGESWVRDCAGGAVDIGVQSRGGSLIAGYIRTSPPQGTSNSAYYVYPSSDDPTDISDFHPPGPNATRVKLPGFIYAEWSTGFSPGGSGVVFDYHDFFFRDWLLASLFALLPLWWLRSRLLSRRRAARAANEGAVPCPTCGYDLRATPRGGQGGRCPECGAIAS